MEIIVSTLILALIMAGLVSTFVSGKRWLAHSRARMAGGEMGKYFLDPLALEVRQDEWNETGGSDSDYQAGNNLQKTPEPQGTTGTEVNIDNRTYTPTYHVTAFPISGDDYKQARKVKVEIGWNE